jgi:hypothetical protein
MTTLATASVNAENTFTTAVRLEGYFNVSISGTFIATVVAQRSIDNVTWLDADSWTAPSEEYGFEPELMYWRIGVKTGGYTSGTAVLRIGREDVDKH